MHFILLNMKEKLPFLKSVSNTIIIEFDEYLFIS